MLCVDGELVSLLGWSTLLKDEELMILAATGEDQALTALRAEEISLVVLTAVNNFTGLVHQMKSMKPEVPIVLFLPAQGDGLHAIAAFVKEPTKLLKTVQELL